MAKYFQIQYIIIKILRKEQGFGNADLWPSLPPGKLREGLPSLTRFKFTIRLGFITQVILMRLTKPWYIDCCAQGCHELQGATFHQGPWLRSQKQTNVAPVLQGHEGSPGSDSPIFGAGFLPPTPTCLPTGLVTSHAPC